MRLDVIIRLTRLSLVFRKGKLNDELKDIKINFTKFSRIRVGAVRL